MCYCCQVDPEDVNYSKVEYVLVDPSCSGSGCVSHVDRVIDKVIIQDTFSNANPKMDFPLAGQTH